MSGSCSYDYEVGQYEEKFDPKVTNYLVSLDESAIEKKITGVELQENCYFLKNATYKGKLANYSDKAHGYKFYEVEGKKIYEINVVWVEKGGKKTEPLLSCSGKWLACGAFSLSGECATSKYVYPGSFLVYTLCELNNDKNP